MASFLNRRTMRVPVENKYGHGEAEVLDREAERPYESQLLTNAEKVSGEVVVESEVLDGGLGVRRRTGGAILQPRTVADFGVEPLAHRPTERMRAYHLRWSAQYPRPRGTR